MKKEQETNQVDEIKAKAIKHLEEVEKLVKKKPVQGMLVSFGTGFLLGATAVAVACAIGKGKCHK